MENIKIGILGCGYQCEDKLDERLAPWFNLAKKYNFVFSFVSAQFKEYSELGYNYDNEVTEKKFAQLYKKKLINYSFIPKTALTEAEARNLALKPLLEDKYDFIWLLDLSDEYYTEEQIENIISFINKEDNQFFTWFSIPFKNYIFSGKDWIDGFCPPRIFRTNTKNYKLNKFYWDNDIEYHGKITRDIIQYKNLPNKEIPKNIVIEGIKHLTWINNEKTKKKILYQKKHFNGQCSYKIASDGNVCLDYDFYLKNSLPIPIIRQD